MGGLRWRGGRDPTGGQQHHADEEEGHLAHGEEGVVLEGVQQRVAGAEQIGQRPEHVLSLSLTRLQCRYDGVVVAIGPHLLDELAQHVQVCLHQTHVLILTLSAHSHLLILQHADHLSQHSTAQPSEKASNHILTTWRAVAERGCLHLQNRGEHLVLGIISNLRAPVENVLAVLQELELVARIHERVVDRVGREANGFVTGKLVSEKKKKSHGAGVVLEGDGSLVEGRHLLL